MRAYLIAWVMALVAFALIVGVPLVLGGLATVSQMPVSR